MAFAVGDRVQQTATANTTVSFTLTGTVTGFRAFSTVLGNGDTTYYSATDASGNWEVGEGAFSTTGPTLTRSVYQSSNAGSGVTFVGTVTVFITYPADASLLLDPLGVMNNAVTIPSGSVWNGTAIAVAYGGTGVTSSSGANSVVLRNASQNVVFNNFIANAIAVTAAAGTTVLTVASARTQILVGSTTQTFQLPNATTLTLGHSFIFVNNSSGNLTVVDNASAVLEVVPSGGITQMGATSIATSAGTWGPYSFIPAAVNWGTNTLALASTVISGGTWQGGTIASGYGGTGLTTFTAANNAIYSTSASALAAGTLPVLAGGTGVTTSTGTGNNVLSDAPSLTGAVIIGGTTDTATLTLGQSTAAQTVNIATGANTASNKTVNIGTGGTFLTNITMGNTAGGGAITIGQSTGAQQINIGNGATLNATTKNITIGNSGAVGSTTNILVGNQARPLTCFINLYGITTFGTSIGQVPIAVASLPSGVDAVSGDRYIVNNALNPRAGSTVVGGGSVVMPVYYDGTNWICDAGLGATTGSGSVVLDTSPTLVTPALGTPSSGTVTNLTGTASININGTVGATTASTGAFTTLGATGAVTLSPANLAVTISPTGTGTVAISPAGALTINPTTASTINNTSIGATTASTGRFTTVTSTIATGTAPFTVASTTQVANLNAATAGTAAGLSATLVATSGGTGQSTYAVGDLLQGGATNTLTKLAAVATGNALISGGLTTASSWGKIGLTTHVSGTLPVANGGTNASAAGITAFNNITGYTAAGATGTTSTNIVFSTSPTFTTSIDSGATFGAFASSTALTIGHTGTGAASTTNIATAALTGAFAKTVNIGTGGTTGSTTGVNINTSVGGTTTVRGAFLVGNATSSTTDGAIFATNNITAFAASDIKFKTNIQTITNAVEKVQLIGGKTFDWTDEYMQAMGGEDSYFMRKSDAGVIAQDVHKAIPELTREREDGSLAVDYPKLVALAFAAIAELKAEIDELKKDK